YFSRNFLKCTLLLCKKTYNIFINNPVDKSPDPRGGCRVQGGRPMKKRRRIFSVVLAAIFLLCLAACQQKEPKMKDGKILLTVCVESSVGLPNVGKGTTMENSIHSIAQYYTANVNPDVTFEFVTLTADQ